jgi:prepilin-type N-terminal cleavage/methylation domain-containing protein
MKSPTLNKQAGFTLGEMMIAMSISSILLVATIMTTISLQKSFNAVDDYFATHMQQVRIIDYLGRDVKRGLSVMTSVDKQSVTVSIPNYLIQAGDPEAVANPALVGTPRTPTITRTKSGQMVDYGTSLTSVVYAVNDLSITRTENGVVTIIASSTDRLVPDTTDVELANTEFTNTTVTFRPIFTKVDPSVMPSEDIARLGTTVCATSYLRNRRRA